MDRCEIRRCRAEASITYLGRGVCEKHWDELTAEDAPPDALRMGLGIEVATESAMEEAMDDGTSKKATKVEATAVAAPAKAKKAAKTAKPKKAAKAKEPKIKRAKVENPVVFAFRLSEAERTRIHDAAGSAKASRFVLAAALAAASGDVEAFKGVVASRASR